jgi:hypothetical protein
LKKQALPEKNKINTISHFTGVFTVCRVKQSHLMYAIMPQEVVFSSYTLKLLLLFLFSERDGPDKKSYLYFFY